MQGKTLTRPDCTQLDVDVLHGVEDYLSYANNEHYVRILALTRLTDPWHLKNIISSNVGDYIVHGKEPTVFN